jgi:chaperonin GroES
MRKLELSENALHKQVFMYIIVFTLLVIIHSYMKDINKKIEPLQDRVLIREDEGNKEKKTSSGIIIPITVNEDKGSKRGEVVAVGKGRFEDGKVIPIAVKVGETVLFQWGDKVKIGDEEYYLVKESEVLAIIK